MIICIALVESSELFFEVKPFLKVMELQEAFVARWIKQNSVSRRPFRSYGGEKKPDFAPNRPTGK